MIVYGRVSCDCCGEHLGQLWAESAAASDLLPAPDFRLCDVCLSSAECSCNLPGCWYCERDNACEAA